MKRLLRLALLLIAFGQLPGQTVTNALVSVFYVPPGGDCTVVACTSASKRMCRNSGTSTTIYACDTSTGFYVPVASGGGGTPGGSNTQVQFNDSAAFGGDSGLLFNKSTDVMTVAGGLLCGGTTAVVGRTTDLIISAETMVIQAEQAGNTSPLTLYRNWNAVNAGTSLNFAANNSASNPDTYASVGSAIISNTAGSEIGKLQFLTQNAGTGAVKVEMDGPGNISLLTAGATVDGKDLDLVPANSKTVSICPSGCKYATLTAAFAGETSTATNPITFRYLAGKYVEQPTCSGQDSFSIIGAGGRATYLDHNGDTGATGTLMMGNCTNYTVEALTIEGHEPINVNAATVGGGKIVIRNNEFIVEGVQSSFEDAFRADQFAAGTDLTLENNVIDTTQDGFTIAQDALNVRVHSINNRWRLPTNSVTGTMELWRLDSVPCFFESIGDSMQVTAGPAFAFGLLGYDFRTNSTGSCAANGQAYISGANLGLTNTTQNQGGSSVLGISVASGATMLTKLHLLNDEIVVTATDAGGNDTAVQGVFVNNSTTKGYAVAGRGRASGGSLNYDFDGTGAGSITTVGVDYLTDDQAVPATVISGDYRKIIVGQSATFTDPATITYTTTNEPSTGLKLDNTNTGVTQEGPRIRWCNGRTTDDCADAFVDGGGDWLMKNEDGTLVMKVNTNGSYMVVYEPYVYVNTAGGFFAMGNSSANDNSEVFFDTSNPLHMKWNNTNKRLDLTGAASMALSGITTNTTLDTTGQWTIDTTANQFGYYSGAAARILDPVQQFCYDQRGIAATDDNFVFFMADRAITITSVGCRCVGTCTTPPTFTLEDNSGNAMTITGTNPTCATTTGSATYAAVTAANGLVAGEGLAFDVTNSPIATTDWVLLCVTYTVDRQ